MFIKLCVISMQRWILFNLAELMCVPLNLNIPLLSYSKHEHLTVSYARQSGASARQSIPFYASSVIPFHNPDGSYSFYPFHASNLSSRFSQAYLYCHSSHLYSDDDLLIFQLHKSFSSLNTNTIFKREANFIRNTTQFTSSSSS